MQVKGKQERQLHKFKFYSNILFISCWISSILPLSTIRPSWADQNIFVSFFVLFCSSNHCYSIEHKDTCSFNLNFWHLNVLVCVALLWNCEGQSKSLIPNCSNGYIKVGWGRGLSPLCRHAEKPGDSGLPRTRQEPGRKGRPGLVPALETLPRNVITTWLFHDIEELQSIFLNGMMYWGWYVLFKGGLTL